METEGPFPAQLKEAEGGKGGTGNGFILVEGIG